MSALNRKLTLIFAATISARMLFYYLTGFVGDDAYITFRYAENLASGLGFVYNAGQPVLGTTTPLFTIILALFGAIGLPIPEMALFVSMIASGMTSVIIYRFALRLRFTTLALLPVIGYMLWPRSVLVDISGMETALFTFLTTAAFYYQHKREEFYALALATLAAITRPEGLGLVLLLLAYNAYLRRDNLIRLLTVPAMLIMPWIIFATFYFGSPIPNSVMAKAALFGKLGTFTIWETCVYFMGWHKIFGIVMFLLALIGGYWLNKKQNFGWLVILWLTGLVAFYSVGRARMFFWYVGPLYPLYFLFVTAAFCFVCDKFKALNRKRELLAVTVSIGMGLLLIYGCYKPYLYYKGLQESQMAAHYEVGVYLNAKVDPEEWVAAEDIGYMGYYSNRLILDRDGLVSPEVIPYNSTGSYYELIADFRPTWVVALKTNPLSQFISEERFTNIYELQKSFASEKFIYDVFRRRPAVQPVIEKRQPQ